MNWFEDDKREIAFYSDLARRHGISHEALNWGSAESQKLRFKVLSEIGIKPGASILDIGCGTADFYGWLVEADQRPTAYFGVDHTPCMIELAQKRFPEARFQVADPLQGGEEVLGVHDYVFASGIFAHRQHEPMTYLQECVRRMYDLCRIGTGFNSLSAWMPKPQGNEFNCDPEAVLEFCKTLTPWVSLRHDYHARDFTVYLYRKSQV
jgi:SAM-dependent methyltransferase